MTHIPPLWLLLQENQQDVCARLLAGLHAVDLISGLDTELIGSGNFDLRYSGIGFECHMADFRPEWHNCKAVFCNPDWANVASGLAINFGDHVGAGQISPAVVAHLLELAARLGEMLDASAVLWNPAKILSGFAYFAESVGEYRAGGAFPVLALIDFIAMASGRLETAGLSWFSGQELAVRSDGLSPHELMRRAVRIAHDVAVNGPIEMDMTIDGLTEFERITLTPLPRERKLYVGIEI